MTSPKETGAAGSDKRSANQSEPARPVRVTKRDVMHAWANGVQTDLPTLTELTVAWVRARKRGDWLRVGLYRETAVRRMMRKLRDARAQS